MNSLRRRIPDFFWVVVAEKPYPEVAWSGWPWWWKLEIKSRKKGHEIRMRILAFLCDVSAEGNSQFMIRLLLTTTTTTTSALEGEEGGEQGETDEEKKKGGGREGGKE